MIYRAVTPREKVLRCVTLQIKTTCEKRKARIEMIKENIIAKENDRIEKYFANEKVQLMYQQREEINKIYLGI